MNLESFREKGFKKMNITGNIQDISDKTKTICSKFGMIFREN